MKKILLFISVSLLLNSFAIAQSTTVLMGSSPFQDSLWVIDTSNYSITRRLAPNLPGFTITGMNGMAKNPNSGTIYTIAKVSGVSGRVLCTYDPLTGVLTQRGNLGDNFSSITFKGDTLLGVTGDGATVPETLYQIDTTSAAKTLLTALGNGADGEVICYNSTDSMIYHWSGNGTVIFEKIMSIAPYTVTNIPIIGSAGGETFGAVHLGGNRFTVSNISSTFKHWDANGNVGANNLTSLPDDLRGLVLYNCQRTISGTLVFCAGDSTKLTATQAASYQWYLNGNMINGATSQNHYATSAGAYTCMVSDVCGNGSCDTVTVMQNTLPVVTITGKTTLCPNDFNTLTGTGGGTRQWFKNGVLIPGATATTYNATTSGIYNMIKYNLNGCYDSAATGITIVDVMAPVVSLGNDTAFCIGDTLTLDAQNDSASYLWNDLSLSQTLNVYSSANYYVTVTDSNSCVGTDSILVTVHNLPVVNLGIDTSICTGTSLVLNAQNQGGMYMWNDSTTAQTLSASTAGTYYVEVVDSNGCINSDTIMIGVNSLPVVNLGADTTKCGGTITLNAMNAGATYMWSDSTTTQTLAVNATGTYYVEVTDSNGCVNSDTVNVTINALPNVTIALTKDTLCVYNAALLLKGESPAGGTFSGTAVSSGSFNPTTAGIGNHIITYTYTDSNGCSGTATDTMHVLACVGINENTFATISIYPNPANNNININLASIKEEKIVISLFDIAGKMVMNEQVNGGSIATLDITNLSNGVYYITIQTSTEVIKNKISINK